MLGQLGLPRDRLADVQVFLPNSPSSTTGWAKWRKRPGVSMVTIFMLGGGGSGGNGVVGANSTAAGGGGGGSGGQSTLTIAADLLPSVLYVNAGVGGIAPAGAGQASRVSLSSTTTSSHQVLTANGGSGGGNAAGATAGAAGGAASAQNTGNNPMCVAGHTTFLAGQAGIIGGTTVAGGSGSQPTNGLRCMGGTGGGGLPAAGVAGTAGGGIPSSDPILLGQPASAGGSTATTPPTHGSNGYCTLPPYGFFIGGTGGGSTHGTATGAGLVGAPGGAGGIGCGGGGGGGALTGSTATNLGGRGGDGIVIIVAW